MTPAELREICDSLGKRGQTRLAEALGWDASTIRRKLSGKSRISRSDEYAVRYVITTIVDGKINVQ